MISFVDFVQQTAAGGATMMSFALQRQRTK